MPRLLGRVLAASLMASRRSVPGAAHASTHRHVRTLIEAFYRLAAQDLRGERENDRVEAITDAERAALEVSPARPQLVVAWVSIELARLASEGALSEQRLRSMDANLGGSLETLTGCERILRTPVPFAYAQRIKTFVALFCFTAPLHDERRDWARSRRSRRAFSRSRSSASTRSASRSRTPTATTRTGR